MYNSAKIKIALAGLVGLKQIYGTQYEQLDPRLTDNILYDLRDIHPLIEMENLVNSYRTATKLGYDVYQPDQTYARDSRVLSGSVAYKSLIDGNIGNSPATSSSSWEPVKVLSEQLLDSIASSIDKTLQAIFIRKKLNSLVKTIVDDFRLYDGRGEVTNKNANNGRFVGFKMLLHQGEDLIIRLPRLAFQFDAQCPDLKLYLFNTSQLEPVKVIPFNYNQAGIVKWYTLDRSTEISLGSFDDGDYIIGYFESDLAPGAQSIKKETNLVDPKLCGTCNSNDFNLFRKRSNYLDIQPFYVEASHMNGTELWDEQYEVYLERNNWGMNIEFTINCDLTDFIISNKMLFAEAISKQAAVDILKTMQFSGLDNQQLQKLKSQINYAQYGSTENMNRGLVAEVDKSIAALDFDLSNLNRVCLPCNESKITGRKVV